MEPTTLEVAPVKVTIDGDATTKFALGGEARAIVRREQIGELHEAQQEIEAAFLALPAFDDGEARHYIETLAVALRRAQAALDVLWYLAPEYDDGEEGTDA